MTGLERGDRDSLPPTRAWQKYQIFIYSKDGWGFPSFYYARISHSSLQLKHIHPPALCVAWIVTAFVSHKCTCTYTSTSVHAHTSTHIRTHPYSHTQVRMCGRVHTLSVSPGNAYANSKPSHNDDYRWFYPDSPRMFLATRISSKVVCSECHV